MQTRAPRAARAARATPPLARCLGERLLGHDGVELLRANLAVLVRVRALDHLEQLRVGHSLAELLRHALEVAQRDVASLVVVKEVEHLLDVLARVLIGLRGAYREGRGRGG